MTTFTEGALVKITEDTLVYQSPWDLAEISEESADLPRPMGKLLAETLVNVIDVPEEGKFIRIFCMYGAAWVRKDRLAEG